MVRKAIEAMVKCTEIKNIFFHECINDILVKCNNVVDLTPEPERIAALVQNKIRYVGQLRDLFPNARILIGHPFATKAHPNITQYRLAIKKWIDTENLGLAPAHKVLKGW